jgi:hypothetical protein
MKPGPPGPQIVESDLFSLRPRRSRLFRVDSLSLALWENQAELVKLLGISIVTVTVTATELVIATKRRVKVVAGCDVKDVFLRSRSGLELFCRSGRSYLLNFPDFDSGKILEVWSKFPLFPSARLQRCAAPAFFEAAEGTGYWLKRTISNFEYLLILNLYSGRSFSDLQHYPVMPWVLDDRASSVLDPKDVETFLARVVPFPSAPIGFLNGLPSAITPEFFVTPECFDGAVLPGWAHSALDFVYGHRRALESEAVSQRLHLWIDGVWGASAGQRLFSRPHPARGEYQRKETLLDVGRECLAFFGRLWAVSFVGYKVFWWDSTETLETWNLSESSILPRVKRRLAPTPLGIVPILIAACDDVMCCVFPQSVQVTVYLTRGTIRLPHIGDVTAIDCNNTFVAVAGADSVVTVFQILQSDSIQKAFAVTTFHPKIACLCVSRKFHMIVCGACDGTISLWSINSRRLTRSVSLEGARPKKVMITPGWGFIVLHCKEGAGQETRFSMRILTLNGQLVGKMELPYAVKRWTAWTSRDGFDYVLFSDTKNCIYVFEAYFAVLGDPVAKFDTEVIGLHYALDDEKIIVVRESGHIAILPYQILSCHLDTHIVLD